MTNQMTDAEFCRQMKIVEPEQYYTYGGIIYDAQPNGPVGRQRWPEWLRQALGIVAAALVFGLLGFAVCCWGSKP